jgi:hypothetical protein
MSANAVDRIAQPPVPAPSHVGQATAIEQSRAVAEVQAAVVVAQQRPRNIDGALDEMRRSCAQKRLAERAFYAFPRAGETISGASVYLARELARVWGNIQYGIHELRRDDAGGYSEMQAWAWDLQTNTRTASTFVVPHKRDTRNGVKVLTDMRDIYESNANAGARRVRECIFAVLPPWFTGEAEELCSSTLSAGSPEELAEKIDKAVAAYERRGVSLGRLERKLGRPRDRWAGREFAHLDVLFGSLKRNEITIDEAFEPERVTAAEIAGTPPATSERVVRPHGPDLHLHDDHQAARLLASMGQQIDPGKGRTKPITEYCGFGTPDGACNLPAGHETGPDLDGYDGHDVVPTGGEPA